jgi:hypothetical protein
VTADPARIARFTNATETLAHDARIGFGTAADDLTDDLIDALAAMATNDRLFAEAMFKAGVQATVARLVERRMVTTAEIIEAYS